MLVTSDRLAQAVFTQQHLSPLEPVAAMSMGQIDDAPVEDPPHEQPPAKDPPVKEAPVKEPERPAPMKSV
jgi:hypothetical protein